MTERRPCGFPLNIFYTRIYMARTYYSNHCPRERRHEGLRTHARTQVGIKKKNNNKNVLVFFFLFLCSVSPSFPGRARLCPTPASPHLAIPSLLHCFSPKKTASNDGDDDAAAAHSNTAQLTGTLWPGPSSRLS